MLGLIGSLEELPHAMIFLKEEVGG